MTFQWTTKEPRPYLNNKKLILLWGAISIVLIIFALWQKNLLMIILFCLIIFVSYIAWTKKPQKVKIKINKQGIKINNELFSFENIKNFCINYDPPNIEQITFQTKQVLKPSIVLDLNNQHPLKLRKFLLKYIDEKPL